MNKIVFFTGAGISAESGISTWRDTGSSMQSVWATYNPDRVCNINNFFKYHEEALAFYNARQEIYSKCKPNAAHIAIAALQKKYPDRVYCITQNVDPLFEDAGVVDVDHVHGSFDTMKCLTCSNEWAVGRDKVYSVNDTCPECNSNKVKPGIIMFGENAPAYSRLIDFCYNLDSSDIMVVIGTSGEVIPMQWITGPVKNGKPPFRILCNLDKSNRIDSWVFDKVIYGKVTEHIDEIINLIENKGSNT
jgi:NAD-dependent deacetylase